MSQKPVLPRLAESILTGAPSLVVSLSLFAAWFRPHSGRGLEWLQLAVALIWLEFVLIHSGLFMGLAAEKLKRPIERLGALLGLAAVYAVVAFGISDGDLASPLLGIYGMVILGRLAGALIPGGGDSGVSVVIGLLFYLPMLTAIFFLPWPHFGITDEVVRQAEIGFQDSEDRVHAYVGGGAFYFLIVAAASAYWPWMETSRDRSRRRRDERLRARNKA